MPALAPADVVLINGRLLTMGRSPARAAAIAGERILALGDDREILSLRGRRTRVVDLRGRLALPGFTDSHVHLASLALRLSEVDLTPARTRPAALGRIAARARRTPPGQWIMGGGFDKNRWGDAFPTRWELDRVAPRHPVALQSRDGHALWVNSAALERCGIDARTAVPSGGRMIGDACGHPSGILLERAGELVYRSSAFPRQRLEPSRESLLVAQRFLLRRGITSIHLMEERPLFGALQALRETGDLCPRVTVYRGRDDLSRLLGAGVRSGFGDEWLRIGGIKLLLDGALGSQTAWLFRPYSNCDAGCGISLMSRDELRDCLARAAVGGLACAIHAIGDRANAVALDILAEVRHLRTPLPHRIEHAQLLRPRDIPRFAQLGVVASMQPCHILGDIAMAERYWGRRSRWAYAVRSLLNSGATVAFGSDAPVETADPIVGVYAAVRRQDVDGSPSDGWYRQEEGIRGMEALHAYTVAPALASAEADVKGKLLPGYLADIVVLSEDVTRLRGRRMLKTEVDLVFVGGRLRYRRRSA